MYHPYHIHKYCTNLEQNHEDELIAVVMIILN